ncbi:dTDP-4-dehydrorhamnose 3,5-epimerase [Arenimonas sp.]|uniref:dTDP-4-dehydrorhamnose 3,5-epimerase n=1 Tax=Arenimonas sp. TaxID=1872635 RepID=UPI0039E4B342
MKIVDFGLADCKLIEPQVFGDARGTFFENWNRERYADAGLPAEFVQSNVSVSAHGTLRGLHHQWPQPQGKLVGVLEGEVYDVAVDIRRGSPTFGRWKAAILSAENRRQLWIPPGFAHGFVVLSERAIFHYLCTETYRRENDAALRWNDARLAIDWPVSAPLLSDKDANAPFLDDIPPEKLPEYRP